MTVTHVPRVLSPRLPLGISRFVAVTVDVLRMLGAATRVAHAVETRRDPRRADLQALGINEKLPAAW